jgi:hypothetical protein
MHNHGHDHWLHGYQHGVTLHVHPEHVGKRRRRKWRRGDPQHGDLGSHPHKWRFRLHQRDIHRRRLYWRRRLRWNVPLYRLGRSGSANHYGPNRWYGVRRNSGPCLHGRGYRHRRDRDIDDEACVRHSHCIWERVHEQSDGVVLWRWWDGGGGKPDACHPVLHGQHPSGDLHPDRVGKRVPNIDAVRNDIDKPLSRHAIGDAQSVDNNGHSQSCWLRFASPRRVSHCYSGRNHGWEWNNG